ncbi:MAG TPA: EamA family transporter [Bacillota bacterium]|nr:EamA family transporter [Bacillota bacterium]
MDNRHQKAIFYIICTALLWSTSGFLIKWVDWNPVAIAGVRSGIAALVMAAYCRHPKFTWSSAQIGGALAYTVTVILFVIATKLTTAANAILLQYTAPVYVAVFSFWLLGERISRFDWLTIALTLGGMVLFFQDNLSLGGWWGNMAAIGSGAAFAALCLFTRKQKHESSLESLLLGNLLTALVGLPFMFQGNPPGIQGWLALALLGIFQLGLAYILYAKAMKELTALEGILIPVIEPVLNPIWVFLLLDEVPGSKAVIGGLIILLAVTTRCIIAAVRQRR